MNTQNAAPTNLQLSVKWDQSCLPAPRTLVVYTEATGGWAEYCIPNPIPPEVTFGVHLGNGIVMSFPPMPRVGKINPKPQLNLIWTQVDEDTWTSTPYKVCREGIRGGIWVAYYEEEELDIPGSLHFVGLEDAKQAAEAHALKRRRERHG